MKFIRTAIPDVCVLQPQVFGDNRGCFSETFNLKKFEEKIYTVNFMQDNESNSTKGVLRGLHFQRPPYAQAKLVRCIKGRVMDVAVDIRENSATYGKHIAIELSETNRKQLFIPRGFAHGFAVLSESAIFSYKVDNYYAPEYDAGIRWDDSKLNIQWGVNENDVIVSEKDTKLPFFSQFKTPFTGKLRGSNPCA